MPAVFQFSQGSESRRFNPDSSPLLGRFRAVPPRPGLPRSRPSQVGLLSTHAGYGSVLELGDDEESDDDELDDELLAMEGVGLLGRWWRKSVRRVFDLWIEPRQGAVKKVVNVWWSRYGTLILMPASLVSTCALSYGGSPSGRWAELTGEGGHDRLLYGVQFRSHSTPSQTKIATASPTTPTATT